jgi:P-type E1-E2 ATPase
VKKGVDNADPLLIGGCLMLEGEGRMLVTAVGTSSKMGQTVALVEGTEHSNTPLQDRLEQLAGEIGRLGTFFGGLTFLVLTVLWAQKPWDSGKSFTDLLRFFIVGVTIVVVAVPEGLPLAVTISLAFSMRRMMKDKNLVRELQACETMGSASTRAAHLSAARSERAAQTRPQLDLQ